MIKAVFFDFFDVLAVDGERLFFEKYVPEGSDAERQCDAIADAFMQGKIDYAIYRQKLADITNLPLEETGKWLDNNRVNKELFDFIKSSLKGKYKLGIISNAGDDWVSDMLGEENAKLFDEVVLSYDVHYMKPAPEIYQIASERIGVSADECLFTDDKLKYCTAAEEQGMKAIQFTSTKQFISDFKSLTV